MSFVTVYSDLLRAHTIYPNSPCRPENRYAPISGRWLKGGGKQPEVLWSDEEKAAFLRRANRDFFWTSTYTDHYCKDVLNAVLTAPKGRKSLKCVKAKKPKKVTNEVSEEESKKKEEEEAAAAREAKEAKEAKAKGENELMKAMREVFERDPERLVRQPLDTHKRILGYSTPSTYQCGFSIYQEDIAQPGYVLMRDHLVKPIVKENCHRPKYAISPLHAVPDGERLIH